MAEETGWVWVDERDGSSELETLDAADIGALVELEDACSRITVDRQMLASSELAAGSHYVVHRRHRTC